MTGRSQLILVGDQQVQALGLQAYNQMMQEMPRSNNRDLIRRMQNVGERIAAVSPKPDWDWEFTLFENDSPNAFALPGGKVGVNTGLFKVAKNDDQLAAVIGHEVAHAIARHGNERMSQGLLAQGGVAAAGIAAGGDQLTVLGTGPWRHNSYSPFPTAELKNPKPTISGSTTWPKPATTHAPRSISGGTWRQPALAANWSGCRPIHHRATASSVCRS